MVKSVNDQAPSLSCEQASTTLGCSRNWMQYTPRVKGETSIDSPNEEHAHLHASSSGYYGHAYPTGMGHPFANPYFYPPAGPYNSLEYA